MSCPALAETQVDDSGETALLRPYSYYGVIISSARYVSPVQFLTIKETRIQVMNEDDDYVW